MKMITLILVLCLASCDALAQRVVDATNYIFRDTASDNVITVSPPSLSADYTLTWPTDDGANGECLQTDGTGVLAWGACGGGGISVGDGVTGGTNNAILQVDGSGNLANSLLTQASGTYNFGNTGDGNHEFCNTDVGGRACIVDLHSSDAVNYSLRVSRSSGVNGVGELRNTGTGTLTILQEDAGDISFETNSTPRFTIQDTGELSIGGRIFVNGIHNVATSGGATAPEIISGTYAPTPVGAGGAGIPSITTYFSNYLRVGNVITISGRLTVTHNAGGFTILSMPYTSGSNYFAPENCGGVASPTVAGYQDAYIFASVGAQRYNVFFKQAGTSDYYYTVTCIIP